jgi:O-antigen/teichoic acid export membrane protein
MLNGLLIASAISAGIRGTNHICEYTLWRRLEQRTLSILWFSTATCGTLTAIALAYWLHSAWALILGNAVTEVVQVACTHYVGRDLRMKLQWEKETIRGLRAFGRWIFASSLLSYFVGQGDRVLLGSLLSMDQLGRYSLASNLGGLIPSFVSPLYGSILLPLFAQHSEGTTPELLKKLTRSRSVILLMLLPPLCVMAAFGDVIVSLLWDARYHEAGWMVQVFSVGQLLAVLGNIGPIYLARNETWISMVLEASKAIVLFGGVMIGYHLRGVPGVIVAVALSVGVAYPLWIWISRRYGVWLARLDAMALAGSGTLIALLFLLKHTLFGGS